MVVLRFLIRGQILFSYLFPCGRKLEANKLGRILSELIGSLLDEHKAEEEHDYGWEEQQKCDELHDIPETLQNHWMSEQSNCSISVVSHQFS